MTCSKENSFNMRFVMHVIGVNKLKVYLNPKHVVSTSKPFDLVHMDLFRPTRTLSLNGKRFGLVIVDDYSRFS